MKARAISTALVARLRDRWTVTSRAIESNNITYEVNMTSAREPDDRGLDRTLRSLERRISRLEDTQITWSELNNSFERVHDKIDALKEEMNARFDCLENSIDRMFGEQNQKLDIILHHIIGLGNS